MTSGYVFTLLTILAAALPTSARRGGGGGGSSSSSSGSGSGSGNGGDGDGPDFSVDLDLSSLEAAVFSFYIIFALFTAIQTYYAAGVFRQRAPQEDFPRRIPFALLLLLTTLTLTTHYILGSVIIGVEGRRTVSRADPVVYALFPFMARIADICLYGIVLLLTLHRRNAFIKENQQLLTQEQIVKWASPITYRTLPLSFLGMLSILNFVQLGLALGRPRITTPGAYRDFLEASKAMGHLSVAFYTLLTIHLVSCTWSLSSMVRKMPSASYALFDQNVLSPLSKIICPILTILTLYGFILHIILSVPRTPSFAPDLRIIKLVEILLVGFLTLYMISTAIGLGRSPKTESDDESDDEERKVKA